MQIMPIEEAIRKSAQEAFLSGKGLSDVPVEMLEHADDWRREFLWAKFDGSCA